MLKILVELPQHTFLFNGQKKNVLHEQHDDGGPPWVVHLFRPWVFGSYHDVSIMCWLNINKN
jgi:hypothetical protein